MSNFVSELRQKNKRRGWQLFFMVCALHCLTIIIALIVQ